MNLTQISTQFADAVHRAEMANAVYKADRDNRTAIARYIRALRRCDRLRRELKTLMETGKL